MALFEGSLHRVHGAVRLRQALNRCDLAAVGLCGQHIARLDGVAVFDNSARATLGRVAAHVGTRELQVLAQYLHQRGVGWYIHRLFMAVNLQMNLHANSPEGLR